MPQRNASNVDVAAVGRLLAVPARAAMLEALFDGDPWPVGRLAERARVAPSTASEHLQALCRGGLVTVSRRGRERCYRLRDPDVADALERLGTLAPPLRPHGLAEAGRNEALRAGRTCYDHLAGRLGVAVSDGLVGAGALRGPDLELTPAGGRAFAGVGIDVDELARRPRPVTRACLDWSERRPHLAGALGAALLGRLLDARGLERRAGSRAVSLLPPGRGLLAVLGVALPPA